MWSGDISGVKPYTKRAEAFWRKRSRAVVTSGRLWHHLAMVAALAKIQRSWSAARCNSTSKAEMSTVLQSSPKNSISRLRHTSSCVGRMSCTTMGSDFILYERKQRTAAYSGQVLKRAKRCHEFFITRGGCKRFRDSGERFRGIRSIQRIRRNIPVTSEDAMMTEPSPTTSVRLAEVTITHPAPI